MPGEYGHRQGPALCTSVARAYFGDHRLRRIRCRISRGCKPESSRKRRWPEWTGLLIVATSNDTQHRNGPGYLTLIDPSTAKIVGKIPDGGVTAHEIIISSDGKKAFAPLYGNAGVGVPGTDGSAISVIDITSEKQAGTIDYGHGVRPHWGVRGPDGTIYVTTELVHAVSRIDPKTVKVFGSLPTGQPESHSVAVSHDGKHAYTSNVTAGTVSVMDVKQRKLLTVIPVSKEGFYPGLDAKNPWRAWKVQRISISPDDQTVFTCDWPKITACPS
jgi:DNA-binding beta-propeller fold protein YncE